MGGGKTGFANGAPMRVPPREAQDSSLADGRQVGGGMCGLSWGQMNCGQAPEHQSKAIQVSAKSKETDT